VRVNDNGSPAKFDTKTFTLVVTAQPGGAAHQPCGRNLKQIHNYGDVGLNYDSCSQPTS
jgi:hypothetical protein